MGTHLHNNHTQAETSLSVRRPSRAGVARALNRPSGVFLLSASTCSKRLLSAHKPVSLTEKTSLPTRLHFRFCSSGRLPFQATSSLSTTFSIFPATLSFAVIVGAGVSFVTTYGRAKAYLLPFDSFLPSAFSDIHCTIPVHST